MSRLLFLNVGENAAQFYSSLAVIDPQLRFFENFPGKNGVSFNAVSNNTMSFHAVNIPLSISFNSVVFLGSSNSGNNNARTFSASFGLYSLTGSTLSLANSASWTTGGLGSLFQGISWISMATSATQNITPGQWYFGFFVNFPATSRERVWGNSSVNPENAIPGGFIMGRMTASTAGMPASIATSDLDTTGSDAIRQPYLIISA